MAVQIDPLSPAVVYATKPNIKYPGSAAQATSDETNAATRLNDAFSPVTVTVPAGTISNKLAL
jgi:hypothetical protein